MLPSAIKWLRLIGKNNREMLRHLYFYDRSPLQDRKPKRLEILKGCEIFTELDGKMETLDAEPYCCAHLVTFGNWQRKAHEAPLSFERDAIELTLKRLRIPGEG